MERRRSKDEAKVGKFVRLLEAVHRLFYAKDDVGLAGGVGLDEGKEIKAGENVRGELAGEDFDVLGRVEVGAKVILISIVDTANFSTVPIMQHNLSRESRLEL